MIKYCISIDWLQVYCICNQNEIAGNITIGGRDYVIKPLGLYTPLWTDTYEVLYGEYSMALLYRSPRSAALDSRGACIKLDNRVLYTADCVDFLMSLIAALDWEYKGVTRLDLCYDCNYLHGGRSVQSFLMDYFTHPAYCEGHIIRSGSRKVQIVGSRESSGATRITAMRWGSPQSDISSYCYNKTLELIEVKDKPWIREAWERAGLVNAYDENTLSQMTDKEREKAIKLGTIEDLVSTPVWRFEISIKAHGKDLLNMTNGEIFSISLDHLLAQEYVEDLFHVYAKKVFDFRMSTGQRNIRFYPPLQIFSESKDVNVKPIRLNKFVDSGRTEKICANKLEKLYSQYIDLTDVDRHALVSAMQFLREIGGEKRHIVELKKELSYLDFLQAHKFRQENSLEVGKLLDECCRVRDTLTSSGVDFVTSLAQSLQYE